MTCPVTWWNSTGFDLKLSNIMDDRSSKWLFTLCGILAIPSLVVECLYYNYQVVWSVCNFYLTSAWLEKLMSLFETLSLFFGGWSLAGLATAVFLGYNCYFRGSLLSVCTNCIKVFMLLSGGCYFRKFTIIIIIIILICLMVVYVNFMLQLHAWYRFRLCLGLQLISINIVWLIKIRD